MPCPQPGEALNSDDADKMKKASDELRDAAAKLAEELYKQAAQEGQASGEESDAASSGSGDKKDVYDAEFKEKTNDKESGT